MYNHSARQDERADDDDVFPQRRGNDVESSMKRCRDEPIEFVPDRFQPKLLADQRYASTQDDPFGRSQHHDMRKSQGEGATGAVENGQGDRISPGRGASDKPSVDCIDMMI